MAERVKVSLTARHRGQETRKMYHSFLLTGMVMITIYMDRETVNRMLLKCVSLGANAVTIQNNGKLFNGHIIWNQSILKPLEQFYYMEY